MITLCNTIKYYVGLYAFVSPFDYLFISCTHITTTKKKLKRISLNTENIMYFFGLYLGILGAQKKHNHKNRCSTAMCTLTLYAHALVIRITVFC